MKLYTLGCEQEKKVVETQRVVIEVSRTPVGKVVPDDLSATLKFARIVRLLNAQRLCIAMHGNVLHMQFDSLICSVKDGI